MGRLKRLCSLFSNLVITNIANGDKIIQVHLLQLLGQDYNYNPMDMENSKKSQSILNGNPSLQKQKTFNGYGVLYFKLQKNK